MATGPGRGQDLQFTLHDGTSVRDISPFIRSVTMTHDAPVIDKTAAGAANRTFLKGIMGATITLAGVFDNTALTGTATVLDLVFDDTATRAFVWGPQGTTTGYTKYTGSAWVTSYNKSEDYDGIVLFTATLTVDGAVTVTAY